jgi:hypothetical protein
MQYIQPILKGFLLVDAATKSKIKDEDTLYPPFLHYLYDTHQLWHIEVELYLFKQQV